MALTLRPTQEQLDVLQEIQAKFGESTHSKALFRCCHEYLKLAPEHKNLQREFSVLQTKYEKLLSASKNYLQAQADLSVIITENTN